MKGEHQNKYIRIFRYANRYKKLLYSSIVIAIILSFISPLRPFLIQKTIQDYIQKYNIYLSVESKDIIIKGIITITILQLVIICIESVFTFIFSYISAWLGQLIVKDIRVAVFEKILNLKINQFDKIPVGTLTTRTINDIEAINNIFSDGFIPILADLLSIIIVLATMFYVNVKLTLVSLIAFPILLMATYIFKQSVKISFNTVRTAVAQLNTFVQERLSNIQFIQTNNLQHIEFEKFKKINEIHKKANIKSIMAYSVFFPIVEIISAVSISILIYSSKYIKVDPSLVVFYFLSLNQIFKPLRFIADRFNIIQMGMVASERVFIIMDNKETLNVEIRNKKVVKEIDGSVEFVNVSFFYTDEKNKILNDINFKVNKGEKLALVGPTGSGKSSIINLINRLYQHQQGKILIDGIEVEKYDLNNLRKQIGVIIQHSLLFSGSIRDNLTLNNEEITEEQILCATKQVGLHDMIMGMPQGYEFDIMEKGALLSEGQKQLIAFARTMIYNPKILIMDEATSSIDKESESIMQMAMHRLMHNKTSIIVAHRLSTIKEADRILFIKNGQILESGTHNELIQKKGRYFDMYYKV